MIVYIQAFLLILFGGILVEAGIGITSIFFWLLISTVIGILLTFDPIILEVADDSDESEKP